MAASDDAQAQLAKIIAAPRQQIAGRTNQLIARVQVLVAALSAATEKPATKEQGYIAAALVRYKREIDRALDEYAGALAAIVSSWQSNAYINGIQQMIGMLGEIEVTGGARSGGAPPAVAVALLAISQARSQLHTAGAATAAGTSRLPLQARAEKTLTALLATALTAATTATVDAFRAGADQVLDTVLGQVEGWIWKSRLAATTCPACWAMHGTRHPVGASLRSHPNCKCIKVPYRERFSPRIAPGDAVFAGLPRYLQQRILGPGAFRAYDNGTPLAAFVGRRIGPDGHAYVSRRPLRRIMSPAGTS